MSNTLSNWVPPKLSSKEISDLKKRWIGINPLSALYNPPFQLTKDGRVDLRYLPLRELTDIFSDRISLQRLHFKNYDFSGAAMHWLLSEHSVFENCIFEKTILTQFSEKGNLFSNCVFSYTDLRLAQLGSKWNNAPSEDYESLYRNCLFKNIKTSKIGIGDPVFVNCHFNFAKLNDVDWGCSGFWGCEFEGVFNGMMFYGNYKYDSDRIRYGKPNKSGLHKTSFRKAKLRYVGLREEPALEDVEMPSDGNAFFASVDAISRDLDRVICDCPDEETKKTMKTYLYIMSIDRPVAIVSRYDLLTFELTKHVSTGDWIFQYLKSRYMLDLKAQSA